MTRFRIALVAVPIAVCGSLLVTAGPAGASLPSGATHVTVTAGANTGSIDAALNGAASISGKITSIAGGKPVFADVTAYSGQAYVASGFPDGTGKYTIGGLAKSTTGYTVCVNASSVGGGGSPTGYLGRCYKTAGYSGTTVPSNATKIPLANGQHKTGVNISLPSSAAISGKVTSSSGKGLDDVFVYAHNRSTGATFTGFTSAGHYTVKNLTASAKGYTVCFSPFSLSGLGYLARCYKNKGWTANTAYPSTATKVTVSLGHTHTGVNQALPTAGAISGTVTDASNGKPVPDAGIEVFNSSGRNIGASGTNSKGKYTVGGLGTATADKVCVFGPSPSPSVRYKSQCYKAKAWSGGKLPSGLTGVKVAAGHTHTGINFKLAKTVVKLGSIAGTVTEAAGGTMLQNADVTVFTSGGSFYRDIRTSATGTYKVNNLPASKTGYVVCVRADSDTTSATAPTPDPGWAPHCYHDVAWNGGGVPGSATRLPLAAGQNRTGIDVALPLGGSISGLVTSAGTHGPLGAIEVDLFAASGRLLDTTSTSFVDGSYSFAGLMPATGGYVVCFDGRLDFEDPNGYRPQCYNGVAWNG